MWDPLGHTEPLPLAEHFHPLGFPLVLRTNSSHIVEACRQSWGEFGRAFETTPIELRVIVGEGPQPEQARMPVLLGPSFRSQGHLLALVLDQDNFALCDLDRGFGFACLAAPVARDHLYTSFHFLDSLAYTSICQRYVTPIHAACVARDGAGILLVGGSRAGKSSLAWACARAGFAYVSDDSTFLLRRSEEPTLIGRPHRMRFRPDAVELIPELAGLPRLQTVIGKESFEIRTGDVAGFTTAPRCRPAAVVFLDRQPGAATELTPVDPQEARRRLSATRNMCEPRVWKQQEQSLEALLACPAYLLRYSSLDGGVEQIRKIA